MIILSKMMLLFYDILITISAGEKALEISVISIERELNQDVQKKLLPVLCLILLLLPLAVSCAEDQPEAESTPANGSRIEYQDYVYEFDADGYDGPSWEIKEYLGTYLPRFSPDEKIPDMLEGYPVDRACRLHNSIYAHLNRSYGHYLYALVSESECYLTGYNDQFEWIATLPSEIDGVQVVGIADEAFCSAGFDCSMFARVVEFPETIRYIGKYAFALSEVSFFVLNEGLEFIDDYAFSSMPPELIYLPKSLKRIGANPFMADYVLSRGNQPLQFLGIDGYWEKYSNGIFAEIEGALYSLDDMRLISFLDQPYAVLDDQGYRYSDEDDVLGYYVHEGTRIIGDCAFHGTFDLEKIVLPEGLEIIGEEAFGYCTNLNEIVIPSTVTDIQSAAFCACSSLTKVILPEGLKTIGDYAFSECSSLSEITIPGSVVSIGEDAFWWCNPDLILTVTPGSAAENYCMENVIAYKTAAE